jgi:hypothetical protein
MFLVTYSYHDAEGNVCDDTSEHATEQEAKAFAETCPEWQLEIWNLETGKQIACN